MPDQSFPKQMRLRTRGEFRRVYERRCSVGDNLLRLIGDLSELPHPRIGLSVSRKLGNAVARNRWKRLLREAFRLSREKLPPGLDFIVVPRAPENRNCNRSNDRLSTSPGACESGCNEMLRQCVEIKWTKSHTVMTKGSMSPKRKNVAALHPPSAFRLPPLRFPFACFLGSSAAADFVVEFSDSTPLKSSASAVVSPGRIQISSNSSPCSK